MPRTALFTAVLLVLAWQLAMPVAACAADPAGPPLKLGSTVIYVADNVKATLDFYHQAFGLAIRYYRDDPNAGQFGELEAATDATIMIASYRAKDYMLTSAAGKIPTSPLKQPTDVELAFLAADVPAAYARAIAAGAKPVREPLKMPWGQTVAYVAGIEGTLIGLLTPPPAAK